MIIHNKGLVSVSFRELSPTEIIAECKKNNLKYIEWGSDVHAPCDEIDKLNHIAKLQKENGIICSSYGTYFRLGVTDNSELVKYIKAAKILGTNILRVWCGDRGSAKFTKEYKKEFYSLCKEAAKIAEENGVYLCMECHNNTLTDDKDASKELMQEIHSEHFLMFWQPNQFKTFEYNLECIKLLHPWIKHIHIFYWEGSNKFPLREGLKIWEKYISVLNKSHTFLLEFMPDNQLSSLPEEVEALNILL